MPQYWIIALSEDNWEIVKRENVYGAPEPKRFKPVHELIEPGDVLIFYVRKKDSKKYGGKFVGAYRVVSTWYREDKPLWPDEIRDNTVKYP